MTLEVADYRTTNFLNWFIDEQREEEKSAKELLTKYDILAIDAKAVYQLDQQLATRK